MACSTRRAQLAKKVRRWAPESRGAKAKNHDLYYPPDDKPPLYRERAKTTARWRKRECDDF
jgi:hypothetical protein